MNPDLYPDLAAAGSLGAALEQIAADLGVALTVVPHEGGTLVTAGIASSSPERQPLSVYIGAESRLFSVSGWGEGIEVITGATPDLAQASRPQPRGVRAPVCASCGPKRRFCTPVSVHKPTNAGRPRWWSCNGGPCENKQPRPRTFLSSATS